MATPIESESVQGNVPDQDNTPGPNPAWNDVLSILPEQFHSVVTPKFQEWDNAANTRIETLNSTVKEFEAYKPFVEHGINPEELEQGLRLMYEINNNPQGVYEALANAYKFGQTPGAALTPVAGSGDNDDDNATPGAIDDPRYAELQQGLELVSKIVLNDAQAKEAAVADQALDKELSQLKEAHGDYDEDYVITKMLSGMSGEDAIKSYQGLVQRITPQPFAPSILGANSGSGSGLPSNAIDPTKLSGKDTRSLVAQMLEQAAQAAQ